MLKKNRALSYQEYDIDELFTTIEKGKVLTLPMFQIKNPFKATKPDPNLVKELKKNDRNLTFPTLKIVGEDKYELAHEEDAPLFDAIKSSGVDFMWATAADEEMLKSIEIERAGKKSASSCDFSYTESKITDVGFPKPRKE